ncbi:hypothetical protein [Tsuneonella amylolytica]|uniref:hypothetical protein n=1 Tax=Tsuneonella amylolytica TaxID=2338327 RepID=UPI0013C44E42|nr:hypothetical protein [Tsuneonella amylolytica]
MRRIACIALAVSLAALVAAPAAADRADRGEARLAKMLDGRVAGAPEDCIRDFAQEGMTAVDGVGFVFRRGDTLWVNRPAAANFVDDGDLPVIEKWSSSQLCVHDRVEMRDRLSLIPGPVLTLGEFVPFRRPTPGDMQ